MEMLFKLFNLGGGAKLLLMLNIIVLLSSCSVWSLDNADNHKKSRVARESISVPMLQPKAQVALDKVLSEGLVQEEFADEDISPYLQDATCETKYVLRILTNNKCYLGDSNSILRTAILPSLCKDLDEILKQQSPTDSTLDHAIWMASKLELNNLISFLIQMGAPANKYTLGL